MSEKKIKKRIPFTNEQSKIKHYEFLHYSVVSPHPQKIDKGGQDAVFVSKNVLVVADGVGSWKDYGIDPGIYSKNLIRIISDLLQDEQKRLYYIQNPSKLASAAVNLNKAQGSTTLSIITLHPKTGILKTYHIGDSVYGIFKQGQKPILGLQQQYLFNHPYQVGSNFIHRESNQEMQFCSPDSGVFNQFSYTELENSHLVLASDGIWDNVFVKDIQKVLLDSQKLRGKDNNIVETFVALNYAVDTLINMTKNTYSLKNYESPFYVKAREVGLNVGKFAKVDDLSLIIAKVIKKQYNFQ